MADAACPHPTWLSSELGEVSQEFLTQAKATLRACVLMSKRLMGGKERGEGGYEGN